MKLGVKPETLRSLARWCAVGVFFTGLTIPILYVFHDVLGVRLSVASVVTWEICAIIRFFVTDRWVFRESQSTLRRFWKYHVAAASTFVIWWTATNLMSRWGVHYILASVLATGCSMVWSLITSYRWVWRQPDGSTS